MKSLQFFKYKILKINKVKRIFKLVLELDHYQRKKNKRITNMKQ